MKKKRTKKKGTKGKSGKGKGPKKKDTNRKVLKGKGNRSEKNMNSGSGVVTYVNNLGQRRCHGTPQLKRSQFLGCKLMKLMLCGNVVT